MVVTCSVAIGYRIPLSRFLKRFQVSLPEVYHMEERWDPRTGAKILPVKVVDIPKRTKYVFLNEEFATFYGLCSAVAKWIGMGTIFKTYGSRTDQVNRHPHYVVFCPSIEGRSETGLGNHETCVGHSYRISSINQSKHIRRQIKEKLKILGFKTGVARVFPAWKIDG